MWKNTIVTNCNEIQQLEQINFESRFRDTPILGKSYFLIFLLAILHKVLRAAVIVIDKTDCIMKDNSMLILFQLWDYLLSWFYVKAHIVFIRKV